MPYGTAVISNWKEESDWRLIDWRGFRATDLQTIEECDDAYEKLVFNLAGLSARLATEPTPRMVLAYKHCDRHRHAVNARRVTLRHEAKASEGRARRQANREERVAARADKAAVLARETALKREQKAARTVSLDHHFARVVEERYGRAALEEMFAEARRRAGGS